MKRYNRDKRATYKTRTRATRTHDTCDACDTHDTCDIHIPVKYDGYKRTIYMRVIHGKTRDTHAQIHVGVTNAIRTTFPELDTHTAQTHMATAPYRIHPPEYTPTHRPRYMTNEDTIIKDTRTVKCIIYNTHDEIIYIGMMRRTRVVNTTQGTIDITLHRNDRTMDAYEYAVAPDTRIHGVKACDIRAHGVEIYRI